MASLLGSLAPLAMAAPPSGVAPTVAAANSSTSGNSRPAVLAFAGDVYEGLQAGSLDRVYANNVLEHVPDVQGFLKQLDAVGAQQYILTVPDAYSCFRRHFDYNSGAQTFVEVVHPDHNCWYTPYTLANVICKYTPWALEAMFFFNGMSLLAVANRVPPDDGTAA